MTLEEYTQHKDQLAALFADAKSKGFGEEAQKIYLDNIDMAIIEDWGSHATAPLIEMMFPEIAGNEVVEVKRVNILKICEELERLLNPH